MIPLLLETHNFQSHGECVLDFSQLDKITLIIGEYEEATGKSNGAGKTTLFDAIDWVCFDQSRVSGTKTLTNDDLVRTGQKEMWVRFTFIAHDGNTYRIKKTHKKRRYQSPVVVEFQTQQESGKWRAVDKDGNRETKKKIIKTLGFDGDIWHYTALCKQHEVAGIASTDSNERLTLIKKLLRLDKWAHYAEVAKARRDEIKAKLAKHSELLEKAQEAKQAVKEGNEELKNAKARRTVQKKKIELQKEKIEKFREQINDVNKILGAVEQLRKSVITNRERREAIFAENKKLKKQNEESKGKLEILKAEFEEKTERQRVIDNTKPDKEKLVNEYRATNTEKGELQTKAGSLSGMFDATMEQGRTLRNEADSFKKLGIGACPTCKNEITDEHSEKVNKDYDDKLRALREKAKQLKKEQEETEKILAKATKKLNDIYKTQERYNELVAEKNAIIERLKALHELVSALQSSGENLANQLIANNKELEKLQKEGQSFEQQLKTAGGEETTKRHQALIQQLKTENTNLEKLQNEDAELLSVLNFIQKRVQEAEEVVKAAKESSKGTAELRKEMSIYEILLQDFQKTIPTMILENSASMIETEVNRCLTTLSDGFSVRINTQHKNKTNDKVKEVFDIQVIVGDDIRPFELLSGGEKFRVAFAIRVALSIILTQETGIQIGAIFYDEPFNDLDDDGLDKIQEIFVYLSSIFEHQLAITHQNRLKEIFNDVLCVRKGKTGSYIVSG